MKSNNLAFTSLFLAISNVCALNILSVFPYQGTSHYLVFRVYIRELINRGHNVTVISHFPEKDLSRNYHHISLAGTLEIVRDDIPIELTYMTIFNSVLYLAHTGKENCEVLLKNKQVQDLVKSKSKFDVVVVEQFCSDCALGLAYKLKAPVVGMMSHILMPWHYQRLGIPYNAAYVPFHFLGGGTKPTLYQRLERNIFDLCFRTLYRFITQRSEQNTLAQYFDDIPPLEELARDIKFLLVYHNFILTGSRLFPANVIEVGGYHVSQAKPLNGTLGTFINEAKHGVIYISFGSVVSPSSLPAEKLQAILDVIAVLPQRFIWKWNSGTLLADKNKLYTDKWLPQVDILGHPNTVAFFSHAGMGGTTEAIHFGVPMVAMPVLGDQPANGAAIEESGLGVQVQISELNKENLLRAFRKVLEPNFRERVKQVSKAWRDRPLSPLDTAIYWTEFAAKHPNFTFRTAAADTPLYQHYHLDVICVIMALLLILSAFLRLVVCNGKIKCNAKTSQKKVNKNINKKSKRE